MSLTATFYKLTKRLNSTKRPSGGSTYNIILKDQCSVTEPAIQLQLGSSEYPDYNYCYIPTFKRYYFVTFKFENRLWTGYCKVDPMATFKNEIGASTEYIVRAASDYNLKVVDCKYPTISDVEHTAYRLTGIDNHITLGNNSTYIVGIKNGYSTTGVQYNAFSPSHYNQLCQYMFSDAWLDSQDIDVALQKMFVDPFDYIASVIWVPFGIRSISTNDLYFGYWNSGIANSPLSESDRYFTLSHSGSLPKHPQVVRGSYLNGSPYTQLYLDLFTFGRIPLDPNMFLDDERNFTVNLTVDLFTGIGVCKVDSHDGVVFKGSAQCGVPIQLTQSRNDLIKPTLQAVSAFRSAFQGDVLGAASGVANAIEASMPQISSIGAVGSGAAYIRDIAKIDCYYYRITDEELATIGRPLCAPRRINSLRGFIQCENVDVETSGTPEEKQAIIEYMESGFFYE